MAVTTSPPTVASRATASLRSVGSRLPSPDRMTAGLRHARDLAPSYARTAAQAGSWVSAAGWVALGGAVGGLAIGVHEGWLEFVLLGLTCTLSLLLAVAWVLGRSQFAVSFELHNNRVTVGETATGRVEMRNRARRLYFPARIELAVGGGRASFMLPTIGKDERHEQFFDVPTRRRCVITVGPVSSVRSDPLQLLRRTQRWSDSVDLYVHPKTVFLSTETTGFVRDIEGVTTQDLSSNDVSFHALREYQPGDDRRAIHWRTTARVGTLMVRQFEETRRSHLLVVLPTSLTDYADENDFETAISVAASLARNAYSDDREVTVFTTKGLLKASSAPTLLDRLAELTPAQRSMPIRELASRAMAAAPQASVCALVVGDRSEVADLRSAHRTLPLSVTTFAVRCASASPLGRRRIGDLDVVDVPDISWLARAMRSLG